MEKIEKTDRPRRFIYMRVSTREQTYERQNFVIQDYFASNGINPSSIESITVEKITTHKKVKFRKFSYLFGSCKSGDTIYVASLDRIGRSMVETLNIITDACNRDINIVDCKMKRLIENKTPEGLMFVTNLTMFAQMERNWTNERTKDAMSAILDEIARTGKHISNAGNVITHLGREKGCDTSQARAASIESKQKKAMQWRETNVGYNSVRRWVYAGQSDEWILEEFHQQHIAQPEQYSTPSGCDLSLPTLKKWRREFKLIK